MKAKGERERVCVCVCVCVCSSMIVVFQRKRGHERGKMKDAVTCSSGEWYVEYNLCSSTV